MLFLLSLDRSVPQRNVEELACRSLQIGADEAQLDDVRRAYQADLDIAVVATLGQTSQPARVTTKRGRLRSQHQ